MVDKKKAAQKALAKGASIRETAAATGLSKSTVHRQKAKSMQDKALKDPVLAPLLKPPTPQAAALAGAVAAGQKVSPAKRAKRA